MRDNRAQLVREAALKSSATRNSRSLERGPYSLVALLHSAYLTTGQVTHRIRVAERASHEANLPQGFLKPLTVLRRRMPRRAAQS